jgi:indole-3-glycerol phosphate synthase / phosphoribosylanthranilate isomerase
MNKIQELLQRKRDDVNRRKLHQVPAVPSDDRRVNWNRNRFRIIAEIKRSSLSAGTIRSDLDPVHLARSYEAAGADAISVLTEEHFFRGSLSDLLIVSENVSIPVLQKDFVIDEFQILEAKQYGASFVLLIARFLSDTEIQKFLTRCDEIDINAIVEVTNEEDLRKVPNEVGFIGVNARDLQTLQIDLPKFETLRKWLPPDAYCIAESGINNLETLQDVIRLGYHGALIGEHFLKNNNPASELKKFVVPKVKICGITNEKDAQLAVEAGASALGFIFANSPRRISVETLSRFRSSIPKSVQSVGVFRGTSAEEIAAIMDHCKLNVAQTYDEQLEGIRTWTAKTFNAYDEIDALTNVENTLLDLKLKQEELPKAWRLLRNAEVFALAGGLNPGNVAQAISLCHPLWVDVARGVEKEPGMKDVNKVHAFMKAVNHK